MTGSLSAGRGEGAADGEVRIIRIYTLTPCEPCEIVKEAATILADDARRLGWKIEIVPTVSGDKKGLGKVFLAGVRQFPTVNLIRGERVVKSYASVREGWSAQDVAAFLRGEISGQAGGAPSNTVRIAQ